jgi:hypothetical protein
MATKDLVTIANYGNLQEATLLKTALEEQGITSYLAGSEVVGMVWFLGNALGGIQLQVAEHATEQALALLSELEEPPQDAGPWVCAKCGSTVDAGFEVCWSCGGSIAQPAKNALADSSPVERLPQSEESEDVEPPDEGQGQRTPRSADETASRALRAAVLGIGVLPLLFYALYLLVQISNQELSDKALKNYYAATGIVLFMFLALMAFFSW